jgi:hypothetical protein
VVNKTTTQIICTHFSQGKKHDFRLFKDSNVRLHIDITALTDTAYLGLQALHANTSMPKKSSKNHPLSKQDKRNNRHLSGQRVLNENIIGVIKRFKIIADKYRNRRKRFGLRFNLIAGIYNAELSY